MAPFKHCACHKPFLHVLALPALSPAAEVIEGSLQQTAMCHLSSENRKRKKCCRSKTILLLINHLRLQSHGTCVQSLCGQSQSGSLPHFFVPNYPFSRREVLLKHKYILATQITDLDVVLIEGFRRNAAHALSIVQKKVGLR